ncbi:MAG: hypothetical protein M1813_009555 [Trichoglossum hirsutum]|nr:MAG: hypothetical protein M1813_009555 [Trichoglossum hirsutum]
MAIFGDTHENEVQEQLLYSHQGTLNCEELGQQQQAVQPENGGSFSVIRTKIRKRLSRNLASSSTLPGGRTGDETSSLEMEQRTRSMENLEESLQEDLLTDKGAEEGGYDVDARFVGTPVSADSILGHLEGAGSCSVGARYSDEAPEKTPMSWEESGDNQQIKVKVLSDAQNENSRQRLAYLPTGSKVNWRSVLGTDACPSGSSDEMSACYDIDRAPNTEEPQSRYPSHRSSSLSFSQIRPASSAQRATKMAELSRDAVEVGTSIPLTVEEGDPNLSTPCLETRSSFHSYYSLKVPTSPLFLPFQTHGTSDSISKNVWHLSSTGIQRHSSLPRPVSNDTEGLISGDFNGSSGPPLQTNEWLDAGESRSSLVGAPSLTQGLQTLGLGGAINGGCASPLAQGGSIVDQGDVAYMRSEPGLESRRAEKDTCQLDDSSDSRIQEPSSCVARSGSPANRRTPQRFSSRSLVPSMSLPQLSRFASRRKGRSDTTNSSAREFRARHRRLSSSSGFGSFGIPASWGRVLKDETSSLYFSRSNSFSSTIKCSVFHAPIPSTGILRTRANTISSEAGPGPVERGFPVQGETGTNDDRDGKTKPRRHTVGSSWIHTPGIHEFELNSTLALPRISKFVEDLWFRGAENASAALGTTEYSCRQAGSDGLAKYDGSQEWSFSRKLRKFRSEPVPEEDATAVWERALRNYNYERTSSFSQRMSIASHVSPRNSQLQRREAASVESLTGDTTTVPVSHEVGLQPSRECGDFSLPFKRNEFLDLPQRGPDIDLSVKTGAWHRYPSHTRHLRSESADAADRVSVKDFAVAADGIKQGIPVALSGRKKGRSMTFGKGMLKRWGKQRLFRSKSANFKRANTGNRSSIATSGHLAYPELEILPPPSPFLSRDKGEQGPSWAIAGDGAHTPLIVAGGILVAEYELPSSAKTWSQLYEDCIAFPRDGDNAPFTDGKPPSTSVERQTFPRRIHPSGAQAMMRRSTMDFKEMLEFNEAKEREKVLWVAEEAWGASS